MDGDLAQIDKIHAGGAGQARLISSSLTAP